VLPWVYLMFSPILAPKPPKPKAKAKKNKAKRKMNDNPFDESSENSGNPFGRD